MNMDATLAATLSTQLTTFAGDATEQFGVVLPIALGLAISVSVVFMAIRWFRAIIAG